MSKSKKIYQYTLEGKLVKPWDSIADAAKVMGCNESTIRRAANGQRRQACNFLWTLNEVTFTNTNGTLVAWKSAKKIGHLEIIEDVVQKGPKILFIDCETTPLLSMTWGVWNQNISTKDQLISDWHIITWVCKFLGEDKIYSDRCTSQEMLEEDDSRMLLGIHKLLSEADIVVGHNSKKFDIPKLNTRFLMHGMIPPTHFKQFDTLEAARKHFKFTSNRLDFINKALGLEAKTETNFQLWKDCVMGKEDALLKMQQYNINDVVILEQNYLKIRGFITGHPNLDMYYDDATPHCPTCGSTKLSLVPDKSFYTQAVKYQLYRCECGALSRAKQADKFEFKKKISSIPR